MYVTRIAGAIVIDLSESIKIKLNIESAKDLLHQLQLIVGEQPSQQKMYWPDRYQECPYAKDGWPSHPPPIRFGNAFPGIPTH